MRFYSISATFCTFFGICDSGVTEKALRKRRLTTNTHHMQLTKNACIGFLQATGEMQSLRRPLRDKVKYAALPTQIPCLPRDEPFAAFTLANGQAKNQNLFAAKQPNNGNELFLSEHFHLIYRQYLLRCQSVSSTLRRSHQECQPVHAFYTANLRKNPIYMKVLPPSTPINPTIDPAELV